MGTNCNKVAYENYCYKDRTCVVAVSGLEFYFENQGPYSQSMLMKFLAKNCVSKLFIILNIFEKF